MKLPQLALFCLLAIMSLSLSVSGADITGWGGEEAYHLQTGHNTFFDLGYSTNISAEYSSLLNINKGSSSVTPIVCDVTTGDTKNNLIIASGTSYTIYSGAGNTITEVTTGTAIGTISSMGCANDELLIGTNNGLQEVFYNSSSSSIDSLTITISGAVTDKPVTLIGCTYDLGCAVTFNNTDDLLLKYDRSTANQYLYNDNASLPFFPTSSDKIYIASENAGYLENNNDLLYRYNDMNETSPTVTTIANLGDDSNFERTYAIGDVDNDGVIDSCDTQLDIAGSDSGYTLTCETIDGTVINTYDTNGFDNTGLRGSSAGLGIIADFDGDGVNEYCTSIVASGVTGLCYDVVDGTRSTRTKNIYTNRIVARPFETNTSEYIFDVASQRFYNIEYETSSPVFSELLTDNSFYVFADITGDADLEIIGSKSGATQVFFKDALDTLVAGSPITFASNVVDGGFFGYYEGNVCLGTTITFEALECVGDLANCNYYNSNDEDEKLVTDCGTNTYSAGSFNSINPTVECTYNSAGTYDVVLNIQSESLTQNLTNNANSPITLTVSDDNCNQNVTFYTEPRLTNETTTDSGDSTAPSDGDSVDSGTTTETGAIPNIFLALQNNVKLLGAMFIILGLVATTASQGVRSPIVLVMVGIGGVLVSVALGLLSTSAIVLLVVVMLILLLLSVTIFKPNGGGD